MSLGKQRNLIIVAAVGTALLAGTVLLGGYLPGAAQTDEQVKTCPSAGAGVTCAAKADGAAFPQVAAATDAAPAMPCCAAEKPAGGCEKPAGGCESAAGACEKPPAGCCEEPPMGCCEKPEAAGGCCAAKAEAATE